MAESASTTPSLYLGIDCGATTSKAAGVNADGRYYSDIFKQRDTGGDSGPKAVLESWLAASEAFLEDTGHTWADVAGVGLAIPGPYRAYGVLGKMPNMSHKTEGWHFLEDLAAGVAERAGRQIPVATANDGQMAGLGEAGLIQPDEPGGVLAFAPGSGLGCAYVDPEGRVLAGDHQVAVHLAHAPAPCHLLGLPPFKCGCGREWGCFETYTSISGLPQMMEHILPKYPDHELAKSEDPPKTKALSLRTRAQHGDELALEIFDIQAAAMGHVVATGCMAFDPSHIVIGGGLMDHDATTPEFRQRYLKGIQKEAAKYLWPNLDPPTYREAALGELSQAIGAALLIRGQVRDQAAR
jgi:predicted NBD/HSP70 family sugar kinase